MQNSYMNTTKPIYSPINYESRTGLFNGVTSTSLSTPTSHLKNSLFLRNKLTPLRSPPLYNLSEISNTNNRSPKPVQNASGPLLASTRFNVSLGTYSDTKSPGLTNRIVQYSNEAKQKQTPTHQIKYGSPVLFPVVHFFKKDVPTVSPQPRKVTVKIASPDTSWYNSPEFGAKRIGGRSSNAQSDHNASQMTTETETRSVLDALKEISRKRIHMSPDLEIEQDACKRQKRSDTSWYNSPEFGAKRIGGRSSNAQSDHNASQMTTETETRSVLDALKEISRKRIHMSPDLEIEQDACKRQKRSDKAVTTSDNNKRAREEDSPIVDSQSKSAVQQSAKKICVVDMLAASYTSSQLYKEQLQKGLQKKTELPKGDKHAAKRDKLLNVATQTKESRLSEGEMDYEESHPKPFLRTVQLRKPKPQKTVEAEPRRNAFIFDEARLEISRKNRLATFLSALTGEEPVYWKYEKPKSSEIEGETVITAPITSPPKLISILSPSNKPKHDKHVTFNLPPENNGNGIVATSISTSADITNQIPVVSTPTKDSSSLSVTVGNPETPKSILTAPTVTKLNFGEANSNAITKETTISINPIVVISKESKMEEIKPPQFGFTVPATQVTTTSALDASPFTIGKAIVATIPSVSSLVSNATSQISSTVATSPSSSTTGGFKFDLMKSPNEIGITPSIPISSSTTSLSQNKPAFDLMDSKLIQAPTLPGFTKPESTVVTKAALDFGENKPNSGESNLAAMTSATVFGISTITDTKFNSSVSASNAIQTNPIFPQSTASNNFGSNSLNFAKSPNATTANSFVVQPSGQITTSGFGTQVSNLITSPTNNTQLKTAFGTAAPIISIPGFGTTVSTSSNVPGFGIATTSSNPLGFGTAAGSSNMPTFGTIVTSSNTPAFGTSVTSSNPTMFGNVTTSSNTPGFSAQIVTSSNTPAFSTSITSSNAPNGFGTTITNTSVPKFGIGTTSSTNASGFGASSTTPAFGFPSAPTTSTFAFNTTNTTSSAVIPAFGTATTTSSMFGNHTRSTSFAPSSSGFGTSTTGTPVFGTPISATPTTSSGFPSTNPATPIFNTTTTSSGIFENKNENKPFSFGSGQNNLTTKPAFNFSASTTSSTTGFNNKSAVPPFGTTFQSSNTFGTGSGNQQSVTTTTAASNIFKSPSTTSFGTTSSQFGTKPENTFGTKTENVFGAKSENTFGSVNNSFGLATNTSGFGSNNNNTNAFGGSTGGTFGSNTSVSGFGANSSNTTGFGANSGGFGTSSNNPNGFSGANSNNTGGFGMNSSNNNAFAVTPVSSSGFGAASNASNTFGASSNTSVFGSGGNNNNNTTFGGGNVFGNTNSNPLAFGFNNADNTSAFAKSPAPSGVFGNPATGDSSFQFNNNTPNQSGFGNTTNPAPSAQGGVFAFGSSNQPPAAPSAGIFTFGSNESKPGFNFNPGSNPTQGFGVSAPNFNTAAAPGFNPPTQFSGVAGVFSIGSGSTPGSRSRAQLKPKRRT
ncbi:hypothetical protein AMK59_8438 [Oryctes borbonicus]|uniref:Uncharacterized protein n=1 Tax=Oryctes borbonicus TaxID=1629725 RepID=A0A0T6ATS6_9SCAR|nr:hypothetical protein AMK59_8438 [Oryctes borbonicus]